MVKQASAAGMVVLLTAVWSLPNPVVVEGAFRFRQEASTQEKATLAKGMEAVGKACVQCHALRPVTLGRKTAEQWRDTVYGMIGRGAQVRPDEIEPMTMYLAATFGPQAAGQPSRAGQAANGSEVAGSGSELLPDGSGRGVLLERCAKCHPVQVAVKVRQSAPEWGATIRKMRSLGAVLSAEEEKDVTAYLTRHFGPPAP